jgi:hypothetical protein
MYNSFTQRPKNPANPLSSIYLTRTASLRKMLANPTKKDYIFPRVMFGFRSARVCGTLGVTGGRKGQVGRTVFS